MLVGWSTFGLVTVALQVATWTPVSGLALALAGFGGASWALPAFPDPPAPAPAPGWDLPLRMAAAWGRSCPAMWSFALFCFVLAVGVVGLGHDLGFLLALAVHPVVQGVVWLGLDALANRESARRGPRAARRSG